MKNFIKAILFMFMIGMVIDISPQSTDPPTDKAEAIFQAEYDINAITIQSPDVTAMMVHSDLLLSSYSQIPTANIGIDETGHPLNDKDSRSQKPSYLDKHYDPGSCASYIFI